MSDAVPSAAPATSATPNLQQAPAPRADAAPAALGQPGRGPDGKFTSHASKPPEAKPAEDDPEYDLGDGVRLRRSALKSELGRARSSSKLLTEARKEKEEAARLRSEYEAKRTRYVDDLDAFFEDAGISDPDERARRVSKYIHEKFVKPESMTAEQRRIAELEGELQKRQQAEKAQAEEKKKAEVAQLEKAEGERLRKQVAEMIKSGGLPMSAAAVKRVAERIATYEERGIELDPAQAAKLVRDELASDTSEILASAPVEELRELWGPEKFKVIASKFIQWGLSQVRGPGLQQRVAAPSQPPKQPQYISPADYERMRAERHQ